MPWSRPDVKRLVFSSTCATFGPPERVPIDETLPQRPINPYGESKLIFERILRWYDEIHGIKFVALRYFNAAGASEKFGEDHRVETHLIPNVFKVALGQKSHVEIYGTDYETPDGTCIRDYIHILDLSQAHILALDAPKSEFYNLGTGGGSSVREVIETCRKITGRRDSGRREAAPRGRSAATDCGLREDQRRAWLEAALPADRCDRRERLEVAPEIPQRLRGLINVKSKTPAETRSAGALILILTDSTYGRVVVVVVVVSFVISVTGFCTVILETTMRSPSFT